MATRFPARASEAHCIPKQTNNHNNIVGVTTECVKVVRGDPRNVVGDGYKKARTVSRAVPRKVLTITIRHCNPFNYKVDYERT